MHDVYYSPEKYGLKYLYEIEDDNANYSFDTVILWQHDDGKLYMGQDEGCSCPTPFEDVTSLTDLTEIRSVADAQQFIKAHDNSYHHWKLDERLELFRRVREALSQQ